MNSFTKWKEWLADLYWVMNAVYLISAHVLSPGPVRLEGEVNVLLVGSADPRHILKTMAGLQGNESLRVSPKNSHVLLDFSSLPVS